jgi:thiamine-monophosphate kinase
LTGIDFYIQLSCGALEADSAADRRPNVYGAAPQRCRLPQRIEDYQVRKKSGEMTEDGDIVSSLGEFGLIERLRAACPDGTATEVIVGIGDDAAAIRLDEYHALLATCDIQIEGVHFRLDRISPGELGRRAMAVNISDIAAMGGRPTYALVSMALPADFPVKAFEAIFGGMREQMAEYSCGIVGGNLARTTGKLVIDVFVMGRVAISHLLTGLVVLDRFGTAYPKDFNEVVVRHRQPIPRVETGVGIAQSGVATAMIDLSDGLAADLGHICRESGVGAEINEIDIPCGRMVQSVAAAVGGDLRQFTLYGGEDYELLFTVRSGAESEMKHVAEQSGVPLRKIGRILPADAGIKLVGQDGARVDLQTTGWDHFVSSASKTLRPDNRRGSR